MNYKNCKPTTRFEIGDLVLPDDFKREEARLILKVLEKGYEYTYKGETYSSVKQDDPYMIWWGKIN
jgi:hypothetical protein